MPELQPRIYTFCLLDVNSVNPAFPCTKMQEPQPSDGKHFAESEASGPVNSAELEFTKHSRQTAGIVSEEEMEFVQTHYSPRGVVLLYFQGDAAAEVDRHFNRTFAELCCLPGSAENSMDDSHPQGAFHILTVTFGVYICIVIFSQMSAIHSKIR